MRTSDNPEDWKRCGMTDMKSFMSDKKYLFLDNIYYPSDDISCEHLTFFEIKQNIFVVFFSAFEETVAVPPQTIQQIDATMTGEDITSLQLTLDAAMLHVYFIMNLPQTTQAGQQINAMTEGNSSPNKQMDAVMTDVSFIIWPPAYSTY